MIAQSHTIVHPRAVMVKSLHTPVANAAVARSVCPDNFTISTKKDWIKDFHHFHERNAFGAL